MGALVAPTSMALTCRWRSRPQHQNRTNAVQQLPCRRSIYLGLASRCRTVASRLSNSIGLASNSSHPVAMAFSRSLASAYADMPMIGMFRVRSVFLEGPHGFPAVHDRHFEIH